MNTTEKIKLIYKVINYNLKIVFANKFVYFLTAAWLFYFMVIGIMLFDESTPDNASIFSTLIFPGILIMFYPLVYNVQNDKDARMLEIIFGVPNYRYKVYLIRFAIALLMLVVFLVLMALFAWFAVVQIPIFSMVGQLMYPLVFMACLTFLFTSLVRNGNGTAVIMIIIGLIFFMFSEPLAFSKWNLFLNPFQLPTEMSMTVWMNVIYQNHLILAIGSIISLLWGLMNLQYREKFV